MSKDETKNEAESLAGLAASTLTGDVRDFYLDRLKNMGKPWAAMNENEQREAIHQAKEAAEWLVREVCKIVASGGKKTMIGTLESCGIKGDNIKAVVKFPRSAEKRHELTDAVNLSVSMVVSDSADFIGERGPAEPQPDQSDLLGNAKKLKEGKDKVTALKTK